jgi:hypothetical protein
MGGCTIDVKEIGCERCGLDSSGSGYDPMAGSCEDDFVRGGEFLDLNYQLLKNYFAAWSLLIK